MHGVKFYVQYLFLTLLSSQEALLQESIQLHFASVEVLQ